MNFFLCSGKGRFELTFERNRYKHPPKAEGGAVIGERCCLRGMKELHILTVGCGLTCRNGRRCFRKTVLFCLSGLGFLDDNGQHHQKQHGNDKAKGDGLFDENGRAAAVDAEGL